MDHSSIAIAYVFMLFGGLFLWFMPFAHLFFDDIDRKTTNKNVSNDWFILTILLIAGAMGWFSFAQAMEYFGGNAVSKWMINDGGALIIAVISPAYFFLSNLGDD
ncbi:hypothetical protein [Hellea balneolensis]|uniref:hypothetical protein n=1 Tax=Hellea balneolensis TaxID=287478 RepID=UPI000550EF4B|nr:hypothetical protein [Hellea balneolensis]